MSRLRKTLANSTNFLQRETTLADLPEEMMLQVFSHLTEVAPSYDEARDPWLARHVPFKSADKDDHVHPGLRSYPFLGQVCKKWKELLATQIAQSMMWRNLTIDFGHELVTAIHTPLMWANQRPTPEDFQDALAHTHLSVSKILRFIDERKSTIRTLCLTNSEGFWGDDGEYIGLQEKHTFQASHLGAVLMMLKDHLQELRLYNCNDLISSDHGLWSLAGFCPELTTLVVEGINCRVLPRAAAELSRLKKLTTLSLIGEEHGGQWIVGLESIPDSWQALTSLTKLELRGHQLLNILPGWMTCLTSLRHLDVSLNVNLDVSTVSTLTRLEVLSMQGLDFSQPRVGSEPISQQAKRVLPDLAPLAPSLRALSLSGNRFTAVPACLFKLTKLEVLDLSHNKELVIVSSLTSLVSAMPRACVLDFRGVHKDKGNYWSEAKCVTMKHLAAMAKVLKRRKYTYRFLLDTER